MLIPAWTEPYGAQRATELFESAYGRRPDGVWSAPGRVNLIGEHTDHSGGLCLPIATAHRTFAAVGLRRPGPRGRTAVLRAVSAQHPGDTGPRHGASANDGEPPPAPGWTAYVRGVHAVLCAHGVHGVPGAAVPGAVDIAVDSCVPEGAGLSSSAALQCAVALALAELAGAHCAPDGAGPTEPIRRELAILARTAEREATGVPCGPMDQTASLLARPGHALLIDCAPPDEASAPWPFLESVPFDTAGLGAELLIIDTGTTHSLAGSGARPPQGYRRRRDECTEAAAAMGVESLSKADASAVKRIDDPVLRARARHVLTENARVRSFVAELTRNPGPDTPSPPSPRRLGALLDASHASLRDDFAVSTRPLDLAAQAARDGGAWGARMIGAGFGGCVIALVPPDQAREVATRVSAEFHRAGLPPPRSLATAAKACGARAR